MPFCGPHVLGAQLPMLQAGPAGTLCHPMCMPRSDMETVFMGYVASSHLLRLTLWGPVPHQKQGSLTLEGLGLPFPQPSVPSFAEHLFSSPVLIYPAT